MKKKYMISRIVICAITFLIVFIMFMNEDGSFRVAGSIAFTVIAIIAGFIVTPISKRIIAYGNNISTKVSRIFFYAVLFPVTIIVAFALWILILTLFGSTMNSYFSAMLVGLLLVFAASIILVSYIQALIVLLLGKWIED